jgi:hypothetical protein
MTDAAADQALQRVAGLQVSAASPREFEYR